MVDLDNPRTRGAQIQAADIGVIVGYFALVMLFGLWSSCKNRGSVGGYFLAGRSMHFIPVGASLFASNIGSGHFIGLAGSGAASGIGIAGFELNALFILLILGWVFVPVYISAGVYTMPEYLRKRFGGQRIRVYLAVMALLLSIFTKVAADLYAGAIFIELSLGWNLYASIMLLLVIAAVFTIIGGLTAVIWTDFIQTVIMIIGAFYLMIVSFLEVGSYDTMVEKYFQAVPNTTRYYENHPQAAPHLSNYSSCGVPPANSMHLLRAHDDGGLPWPGMVFGLTISSIWYWCSDQVIVQRALAAKNLSHAKGGTIVAAYLKILPMWLLVIPGMISRILFPNHVGCAEPAVCEEVCESPNGCTNFAYPMLVLNLLPTGARGLMLAVMIAALMSSLTSIFNSSSTIFTMDVWRRIRRSAGDTELLIVGRIFVLFMVAVGIIWIPIVQNFAELFHYIQSITSYLAPPVCAVYVLAILWKRTNEQGAFWSLVVGLVVGLIRFIWEFSYTKPSCGEEYKDKRPAIIKDVHYLHFGIILFVITFIVAVVVSLLTKPIEDKYLHRLLYWNRFSKEERIDLPDEKSRDSGHDNQAADISTISYGQQQHGSTNHIGNEQEELPCWRKSFNWICGIEKQPEAPELTAEAMKAMEEKQNSLDEKPLWRRVNNINAILVMTIAIFFWGFFY